MDSPVLAVALFWALFAATHVGLGTRRPRAALVARLGEWGFIGLFSLVASVAFALVVRYYAAHQFAGPPGLGLGQTGAVRGVLIALVVAGVTLSVGSLAAYPRSPYALGNERARGAYGLERITRHPFFVGTAVMAGAHALLATRLVGTVFFGGLALFALAGAWLQDRKLLARRGEAYAAFLTVTSFAPFGALLAGRQRLALRELPWTGLAVGLGVAAALRAVHGATFAHGGAWVIGAVVGGAAVLALQSWRRQARSVRPGLATAVPRRG
jgi:uncharacterized membrane protein